MLFYCIFSAPPDDPWSETDCSGFNLFVVVFYQGWGVVVILTPIPE